MRGQPGYFIELKEVEEMLTKKAYGLMELVDLGLFHSDHYASQAHFSGQLEGCKINNTQYSFTREDILTYWKKYRSEEFDPSVFPMTIKLNNKELSFLVNLFAKLKDYIPQGWGYDDLIKAMINYFKNEPNTTKLLLS